MTTINIAIAGTPAAASTTIAAGSNKAPLPQPTINVASAASFPASGSFFVYTSDGLVEVFYTGKTGTTFTGCTGGTGVLFTSSPVSVVQTSTGQAGQQPSAPTIRVAFSIAPGSDYTAGGYAFDPAAQLQSKANYDKPPIVLAVISEKVLVSGHVYEWSYDRTNAKLLILKDGANDAGTTDLSAVGAINVLVEAQ